MTTMPTDGPQDANRDRLGRGQILRKAAPIIVANASVPLLGLVDTAVIGRLGSVADLGALALGALIFNFVYWAFGFLRMGTTGFVAQAAGAEDGRALLDTFARGLVVAVVIGVALVLLQAPLLDLALFVLEGSPGVEQTTRIYVQTRIWAAPASLGTFVLLGCLVGLGESRRLLLVQLVLNGLNIGLDVWLAGLLDMGAQGIALGTAVAEWVAFGVAWAVTVKKLSAHGAGLRLFVWRSVFDRSGMAAMLSANRDIMVRTIALLASFALFTNRAAGFGDAVLGANHILLQLIGMSAYFLDGFAFVAEAVVGRAVGARRLDLFDLAVRRTTELAGVTAVALAVAMLGVGPWLAGGLTGHASVSNVAVRYVPYAAWYVLLSFAAFQLDGVFLGATRTAALRNGAVVSAAGFAAASHWGTRHGYQGLWVAFIAYVVLRGLTLAAAYPALRASIATSGAPAGHAEHPAPFGPAER